ncbi:MAG TPA: response regulator, partial [Ignavibacteriaceae bacterium]|nr:response regulator [Ignavibacteriaceae bacterium]
INSPVFKTDTSSSDFIDIVHNLINEVDDDRNNIVARDKVILVVEDDLKFAKVILEKSHQSNLKTVIASRYNEIFTLANKFDPIAITLDVNLPDTNGWKVLDLIKNDLHLRHIPIHVISGEENSLLAFKRGARSFNLKPIYGENLNFLFHDILEFNRKEVKDVLIIEDNELDSMRVVNALKGLNLNIKTIEGGNESLAEITANSYDCIIMDYMLKDIRGNELMMKINGVKSVYCPVIVFSAKDFTEEELNELKKYTNSIILKNGISINGLIDNVITHLHINHSLLSSEYKNIIESLHNSTDILKAKSVLIVDDDVRNLFALTSAFEKYDMQIYTAESGMEAIDIINNNGNIDIILMDIMMPQMDGYEAIRKIRKECQKMNLPIIAVTAKAMKSDRDKSIAAGASDYITKPVNLENLLSIMRIWLYS